MCVYVCVCATLLAAFFLCFVFAAFSLARSTVNAKWRFSFALFLDASRNLGFPGVGDTCTPVYTQGVSRAGTVLADGCGALCLTRE